MYQRRKLLRTANPLLQGTNHRCGTARAGPLATIFGIGETLEQASQDDKGFRLGPERVERVNHQPLRSLKRQSELGSNYMSDDKIAVSSSFVKIPTKFDDRAEDVKPAELIRAAKELQLKGVIAKRKGSLYDLAGETALG